MTDAGRGDSARRAVSREYPDKTEVALSEEEEDGLLGYHHRQHQQFIGRGNSWERSTPRRTSRQKISKRASADSIFWIQWAIILCLAISICTLATQRRACLAGLAMMPAMVPTWSTIELLVPGHITAA